METFAFTSQNVTRGVTWPIQLIIIHHPSEVASDSILPEITSYALSTFQWKNLQITLVLCQTFKCITFANSGHGNSAADAFPYWWSSWIWTHSHQLSESFVCEASPQWSQCLQRVFTYWTRRNRRDEFLVPGFELVNFNDWFLDFNWFLFNWNGNFFLCKSNETDGILKKYK